MHHQEYVDVAVDDDEHGNGESQREQVKDERQGSPSARNVVEATGSEKTRWAVPAPA